MIDDARRLIFVHPEKSGGTSIERAFGAEIVDQTPRPAALFRPGRVSGPASDSPVVVWKEQVMSAEGFARRYPKKWNSYRRITIVRNPATRLLSRHRYFLRCDKALTELGGDAVNHGIWGELLLADIRHASGASFGQMASQASKIGPPRYYDFILRLETLADDWKRMLKKLELEGLPDDVGHKNKSETEPVDILDIVTDPHDRARMAWLMREDLIEFDYIVGAVDEREQQAIIDAMPQRRQFQQTLTKVYPVKQ